MGFTEISTTQDPNCIGYRWRANGNFIGSEKTLHGKHAHTMLSLAYLDEVVPLTNLCPNTRVNLSNPE